MTRGTGIAPCRYLGAVSNCNWERLRGYEEQILVGAEVVNGTGEVRLEFLQEPASPDSESLFLTMTPDGALDFAKLLSRQAHEAMRAKWDEANINSG